jgi:DNA-binding IclR family transcriptional regulator
MVCRGSGAVKSLVQHMEHTFILLYNYGLTMSVSAMLPSSESPSVAVERALAILEAVALESEGLSNAEISRKLQIPKSSASYILRTLEKQGYLNRNPETGKYRVGLKVLSLSRGALTGIDVREVALPIMRHLMEKTNLTCHLAILDGPDAVYIEKVEPQGFIKMDTWVGRRMRVHATSVGKALAAHIPQERLEKILAERGMEKRTAKTITTVPRLLKDLEKVRHQGYAVDDEENNIGARCLGAPIFSQDGAIEASIGLSGTINQVNAQTMPRIVEALKDAARHISMGMGYRAPHRRLSSA